MTAGCLAAQLTIKYATKKLQVFMWFSRQYSMCDVAMAQQ
jgi:hypothetical protein